MSLLAPTQHMEACILIDLVKPVDSWKFDPFLNLLSTRCNLCYEHTVVVRERHWKTNGKRWSKMFSFKKNQIWSKNWQLQWQDIVQERLLLLLFRFSQFLDN